MKQQRIGLGDRRATRTIASAVARAFVIDCGVRMTRAPSTPSSLITAERADSYRSEGASPITSTGLWKLAAVGRWFLSSSTLSGLNLARSRSEETVMSVARI